MAKWRVDTDSGPTFDFPKVGCYRFAGEEDFSSFKIAQPISSLLNSAAVCTERVDDSIYVEVKLSVYVRSVKCGTLPSGSTKWLGNDLWPDAPF